MNALGRAAIAGAFALALGGMEAGAAELRASWVKPTGEVIAARTFTTESLEALPQVTMFTHTPWTTGVHVFSGPSLRTLAELGNAPAVKATVSALNDYSAEVPAEDWTTHGAILVARRDGKPMRIRDKGPFWLLYPYDEDRARFETQTYHARMVWQVERIEFLVE